MLIGVFAKRAGIKLTLVKDNERSHRVFINYTLKLGYCDDRVAYYQLTRVTLITFKGCKCMCFKLVLCS